MESLRVRKLDIRCHSLSLVPRPHLRERGWGLGTRLPQPSLGRVWLARGDPGNSPLYRSYLPVPVPGCVVVSSTFACHEFKR